MNVIIYGASDFALFLTQKVEAETDMKVIAYVVDDEYHTSDSFNGCPLIPISSLCANYNPDSHQMLIAAGYRKMRQRGIMHEKIVSSGFELMNLISKSAVIASNVKMGYGNIVLDSVIIESNTTLGNNNLIWSGGIICHDVHIGHHNYIAPSVTIGGKTTMMDGSFIGMGCLIADKLNVANETLLAAGSLLLKDTLEFSRYKGRPALCYGTHQEAGIEIL
ncbi:MAG: hypothetical protein Q7U78_04205 [Gallionella sp.]|nr:hypothetical protein [Gallionella sp.]